LKQSLIETRAFFFANTTLVCRNAQHHDRRDLTQPSTPQPRLAHGEPTPFVIGQPKASPTQLTPQDSISSIR